MEGSWILHQMIRLRWNSADLESKLVSLISKLESQGSAAFAMPGHKGDLLLVHFRATPDALNQADVLVAKALDGIADIVNSYVSVIELGLYESSVKLYDSLVQKGVVPHSPEWNQAIEETLGRQRTAMASRLFPAIPDDKYVCFYPMNKRRGEIKNWYGLPIQDRQRQMAEHGEVGRRYAGAVRQIISGSIGYEAWEWGVDLFSNNPLVFKHLVYEMRFDEASYDYGEFGEFFFGVRLKPEGASAYLKGEAIA